MTIKTEIPQEGKRRGHRKTWLVVGIVLLLLAVYFLAPVQTNILLLGIDRTPQGTELGRSDTMILAGIQPLQPKVTLLSIPRDLWLTIPGYGENRINTAHYFAELKEPGTGPAAAAHAVEVNFHVTVPYYLRIDIDTLSQLVDTMGGITIDLSQPAGGLPAGTHTLDGYQAQAFVRNRAGSDDFFRMQHGQLFLRAVLHQILQPGTWPKIPELINIFAHGTTTNVPVWLWPRLALALVRAGPGGINAQIIDRSMVTPTTTSGGASVLLPDWQKIDPFVQGLFPPAPYVFRIFSANAGSAG